MSRIRIPVKLMDIEDRIIEYIENNPINVYVDYNDELTDKQVDLILEGHADEVRDNIEMDCYDYTDGELDYYKGTMAQVLDIPIEDVEAWFDSENSFYPSYSLSDHDWRRLLNNTSACIVGIVWDANWGFNNWAYGQPLEYQDVKESLKILGVNPKEFRDLAAGGSLTAGPGKVKGYFPDMPKRVPAVEIKDLYENMVALYDGVMHFCFGDLENLAEILSDDSKNLVIEKGTNVVFYERMSGAGITDVQLTRDITIPRKAVEFRNDTNNNYGVQACYGFTHSYWTAGGMRCKS